MTRKAGGSPTSNHKENPMTQRYVALTVQDNETDLQATTDDLANPMQDPNGYPRAKNGKENFAGPLKLNETPKLAQAKGVSTTMKPGANAKNGDTRGKSQIKLGKRLVQISGPHT